MKKYLVSISLLLLFLVACQSTQSNSDSFPFCHYTFVKLFELKGKGEHTGASSVFDQRTGRSKVLQQRQISDFLDLLANKDSFGGGVAACHEPRLGLVFYDSDSLPCAYLSLCLDCNNIYTKPALNHTLEPHLMGFSLVSRKKLHHFFRTWGFPDKQFSPLFDDKELFIDFLECQGNTAEEIEEELKTFIPQNE